MAAMLGDAAVTTYLPAAEDARRGARVDRVEHAQLR
jgi:predicted amidohydrolase YtcJ